MESPPLLPKKKDVLDAFLAESNVFLHLDPRQKGVIVPKWLQNQPELLLQLGLRMAVPIPDLEIDEEGVSCTLSFNRTPFWCCIPWTAVFAVVSEKDRRGVVWPEDIPPDGQSARALRPQPKRPKLTALGPNDRLEPEPPEADEEAAEAKELPPIGPDAKCGSCGTKWIEDQASCPVCGASAEEALVASGDGAAEPGETGGASIEAPAGEPNAASSSSSEAVPADANAPSAAKAPAIASVSSKSPGGRRTQVPVQTKLALAPAPADDAPPSSDAGAPSSGADAKKKRGPSKRREPQNGKRPSLSAAPKPEAPKPAASRARLGSAASAVPPSSRGPEEAGEARRLSPVPEPPKDAPSREAATSANGAAIASENGTEKSGAPEKSATPEKPVTPPATGATKKRELPPYLRVVK